MFLPDDQIGDYLDKLEKNLKEARRFERIKSEPDRKQALASLNKNLSLFEQYPHLKKRGKKAYLVTLLKAAHDIMDLLEELKGKPSEYLACVEQAVTHSKQAYAISEEDKRDLYSFVLVRALSHKTAYYCQHQWSEQSDKDQEFFAMLEKIQMLGVALQVEYTQEGKQGGKRAHNVLTPAQVETLIDILKHNFLYLVGYHFKHGDYSKALNYLEGFAGFLYKHAHFKSHYKGQGSDNLISLVERIEENFTADVAVDVNQKQEASGQVTTVLSEEQTKQLKVSLIYAYFHLGNRYFKDKAYGKALHCFKESQKLNVDFCCIDYLDERSSKCERMLRFSQRLSFHSERSSSIVNRYQTTAGSMPSSGFSTAVTQKYN